MKLIKTDKAPQAIGPYSQAVVANGIVYTSGQIALTPEGIMLEDDVVIQTKQVLQNLEAVLIASSSSMSQVLKTTIFIADMDDFATINKLYEEAFGNHKPARATVAVKTLPKNALIEIDAVALHVES